MVILINNRKEEFDRDTITVSEMIILKKFSFKMRIVKLNGVFIPHDKYDSAIIKDGDEVQMHYLMSGG